MVLFSFLLFVSSSLILSFQHFLSFCVKSQSIMKDARPHKQKSFSAPHCKSRYWQPGSSYMRSDVIMAVSRMWRSVVRYVPTFRINLLISSSVSYPRVYRGFLVLFSSSSVRVTCGPPVHHLAARASECAMPTEPVGQAFKSPVPYVLCTEKPHGHYQSATMHGLSLYRPGPRSKSISIW